MLVAPLQEQSLQPGKLQKISHFGLLFVKKCAIMTVHQAMDIT